MPIIPFNKFQQYDVEPPILTTYNIWNIYKEEYDSNFGFDKLFLGWLLRCLRNPITYIPRYFKSLKIISLYIRKKK